MPESTSEHAALNDESLQRLLDGAQRIARQAGAAIKTIYEAGDFDRYIKDDESPVTSADYAANEVLVSELHKLAPDIPIISEESPITREQRSEWSTFWLLDPLDGTQEFISRSGDFAVNIALVVDGWPTLGVIYAPILERLYYAVKGKGAFVEYEGETRQLAVKAPAPNTLRVAISRVQKLEKITRYINDDTLDDVSFYKLGSCSLKNCYVAEGLADCYLRVGPTGEWDTGASQVILEEAGGQLIDSEFNALSYNQRATLANPDFMALGSSELDWPALIKPHTTTRDL